MELIANYLKSKNIVAENYYVQFLNVKEQVDYQMNNRFDFLSKINEYKISFIIDKYYSDKLFFDINSNKPIEIEDIIQGKIFINKVLSYNIDLIDSSYNSTNNIIVELIIPDLIIKNY